MNPLSNAPEPAQSGTAETLRRLLSMGVATGGFALLVRAFPDAPCWTLFFLVALVAWPIWLQHKEYALFERRAVLAGLTAEDSALRRWLWPGRVSGVLQVFSALFWATLLLVLGALLGPGQWALLAVDSLLLAWLVEPVSRWLAGQVRGGQVGLVARRWPLPAINVAILALGSLLIDFFIAGAPDTRELGWYTVAERAFAEGADPATCPLAGWLAGTANAIDRLAWHASQVLIPGLPNRGWRLAAWGIALFKAGGLAFAYTRLLLGSAALGESRPSRPGVLPEIAVSRTFLLTTAFLGTLYLYAALGLRALPFDTGALAGSARDLLALTNPCRADARAFAAVKSGLAGDVRRAQTAATEHADRQIDRQLDTLFGEVEQGVEAYLDWYFTVLGEYQRLGALAGGRFAERMSGELERRLFGDIKFDERLERASGDIASESTARMGALAASLAARVKADVLASPCRRGAVDLAGLGILDRDWRRASLAAGGGAAIGALSLGLLARKASAATAGKIVSGKAFQVAARLGGKVAAKRAGSILLSAAGATAICAPAGPLATLCGVGAGAAAWLAFDKAFIEIDEIRFRDEMRAGMLDSVRAQKSELSAALRTLHHGAIDSVAQHIDGALQGVFLPFRDGV